MAYDYGLGGDIGIPEFFDGEVQGDTAEAPAMVLRPIFSGEKFRELCPFPVIVEAWDKRKDGCRRRKYHQQFTEKERATIARYQTRFYRWHLVTGTPRRVMMRFETLVLLQRAVAFFATI